MTLLKSLTNYQKWSNFKLKLFLYKKATVCRFHMHYFFKLLFYKHLLVEKYICVFSLVISNTGSLNSLQHQVWKKFLNTFFAKIAKYCSTSRPLIQTDATNSSFYLVKYRNWTKTVYILSRYIQVSTKLTKVVLFEVGWSHIS